MPKLYALSYHGALHCEVIDSWEPGDAVEFSNESKELAPCNDFHLIGDHLQFNFIVDCIDQLRLQFVSFLFGDKLFQRWDSNQRFFSWNNDKWFNETCFFCSDQLPILHFVHFICNTLNKLACKVHLPFHVSIKYDDLVVVDFQEGRLYLGQPIK